jgi:hypothetical protein
MTVIAQRIKIKKKKRTGEGVQNAHLPQTIVKQKIKNSPKKAQKSSSLRLSYCKFEISFSGACNACT